MAELNVKPPARIFIYRVYTSARTRACTNTHSVRYGRLHLYTDVLGTEIWRTPSDSTRLAIIQFIGLSKAPVHAVFPDRSLSLSLLVCLSRVFPRALFRPCLSPSFSLRPNPRRPFVFLFFSLLRIYTPV